jgi:hypothetical protein
MSRWRDESGSATLLVLAMAGVLMLVGAAVAVVVAMVAAHRAAQSAADLSALAGARGVAQGRDGCARAAQVAGPHWLGQVADLAARSRAGPAGPSP